MLIILTLILLFIAAPLLLAAMIAVGSDVPTPTPDTEIDLRDLG